MWYHHHCAESLLGADVAGRLVKRHCRVAETACDLDRGDPASAVVRPRPHARVAEGGSRARKKGHQLECVPNPAAEEVVPVEPQGWALVS